MDAYKILRIDKTASPAEIKAAYRKMVAKYHPDHGGDVWIFQQIQDAYDELTGKKPRSESASAAKSTQSSQQQEDSFGTAGQGDSTSNAQSGTHSSFQNNRWSQQGSQKKRRNKERKKKTDSRGSTWGWAVGGVGIASVVVLAALGGWLFGDRFSRPTGASEKTSFAKVTKENETENKSGLDVADAPPNAPAKTNKPPNEEGARQAKDLGKSDAAESKAIQASESEPSQPTTQTETDRLAEADRENRTKPVGLEASGGSSGNQQVDDEERTQKPKSRNDGGFVSIFNGENFDSWTASSPVFSVSDGEIVFDPKGKPRPGIVRTNAMYGDFVLKFEFQMSRGTDNGVAIHYPGEGDPAYTGKEIQILDNTWPKYKKLADNRVHGSVWDVLPARKGFLKPAGQWNTQTITVRGSRIAVTLNGTVIVDGDTASAPLRGSKGKPRPGLRRTSGYIGFAGRIGKVKFRNIAIKTR